MSDHTVLVTGSSRGIGRAIALRLARDGFDVVVHCRQAVEQARAVADDITALGRSARVLAFDVADRQAAAQALEADIEAMAPTTAWSATPASRATRRFRRCRARSGTA
jgi:3-oxoacyl-[acyl-carrier protein] reductase